MDILLITPPWVTKDGNIWHGVKGTWPPLGLLYVAAYAEARGHDVQVVDAIAERLSFEAIERLIRERRPRFVGLTAVSAQASSAHRVAAMVKCTSPDSTVVLGGVHATVLPEELLADSNIDYVIRGEGEKPFADLIEGRPPDSIDGLSYRSRDPLGPIKHNPMGEPIADLDSLPTPAYHLIRFDLYKPAVGAYRRLPAIAMMTTRGCPGKCTFCSSALTPFRTRSAEHIVEEIQQLQAGYGIREISFYDDTFTVFKGNVARMCDLIVERGIDVTWSCFARTDCIDGTLLAKMRDAGCHQILYGIESADAEILKNIRKPIDLERSREAVRLTREAGITVRACFMLGSPGETVETMHRTIEFAKELDPDIALFNITVPFPGTQMFDWAKANGYLRTCNWHDYDGANAILELPTVSVDEVNRLYRVAYHKFYLRPGYLLGQLMRLRGWEDMKTGFRALRSVLTVRSTRPVPKPPGRKGEARRGGRRFAPVPAQSVSKAYG